MPDSDWTLEVVDEFNNSTVWDQEYITDAEAFKVCLEEIEKDGINAFIVEPIRQVLIAFNKLLNIYQQMNPKDIRTSSNPDLACSYAATERAALAAQDFALQTNTGIVVSIDCKTVELSAQLIKMREEEAKASMP